MGAAARKANPLLKMLLWPAVLSALGNFETIVNRFDASALANKPSWARR